MDDDAAQPRVTAGPITRRRTGVVVAPGDHVCTFYRGRARRDEIVLSFLRDGILAGDKCIAVLDDDAERIVKDLATLTDVSTTDDDGRVRAGQLDVVDVGESYLSGGGFSPDRMLDFWGRGVTVALRSQGYAFVRAVGEMTWALRDAPGVEDLVPYEARLNHVAPRYPQAILCLYDLARFTDGQLLMDLLRTHPRVLLSGQLLDNPWYLDPTADPLLR
jgi:hypothetical protein